MTFFSPIILVLSFVLVLTAGLTVPALILAFIEGGRTLMAFSATAGLAILFSLFGFARIRRQKMQVSGRQLYLITVSSWCIFGLAGAIPLYLALPHMTFADAVFESISGITTTGSTVLTGLDNMPHSILLWRGLLQWIGGIGIIVLSIAILPFLRVGGMRLFATESSDWSSKTLPRAQVLIRHLGIIYLGLTVLAALFYWAAGMNSFDAVVHAMTTLSTGGYANYDTSLGHFKDKPLILWISSVFMILAALPFALYISFVKGKAGPLLTDSQVRGFMGFIVAVVLVLGIERSLNGDVSIFEALTQVTFNTISIITTTGYASTDYTQWGPWAAVMFFYLMFVGGCSGSTTGSIKVFRYQVSFQLLRHQLWVMRHPSAVYAAKYNGRVVTDDIVRSLIAFSFYFAITIAVLAFSLSLTGLDFVTSLSASTTCVTNVGPGLGNIVGPSGNFASLSDTAKWLLCVGMLLGRLEIMTIIILLTPTFWNS